MPTEWSSIFDLRESAIVDARDVTKTYVVAGRTIEAVRKASFVVKPGTLTVIVGPSGSGKTTLLHILAGLVRPDSGEMLFHGLDLSKAEDDVLRILREEFVSIAYQEQSLVRCMTIEENVELPLAMMDIDSENCRKASGQALDLFGLGARKKHTPSEASGGERQLVNMARALAKNPILVLADEPTANLDQGKIGLLMDVIREEIRAKGTTFIVATHDPLLIPKADMVLEMRDGEIRIEGNTLCRVFLAPMRDLPGGLFDHLKEEIRNKLRGRQVSVGQIVEALGTPFQVTRIEAQGQEVGMQGKDLDRGIINEETTLQLDTNLTAPPRMAQFRTEGTASPPGPRVGSVMETVARSAKAKRRPNLHYSILKYSTIPSCLLFAGLALAIWIQLGVWTAYSTAFAAVGAVLLVLGAVYAPSEETGLRVARGSTKLSGAFAGGWGIQWPVSKESLCDFCGAGWAAEVCHMCGRKMCERCWPMICREPTFCRDHLRCHICGREETQGQHYTAGCVSCLICGNYVCRDCFIKGMCLECATAARSQTSSTSRGSDGEAAEEAGFIVDESRGPDLRTLILEPEGDISNQVCSTVNPDLREALQGKRMEVGQHLEHRGMGVRVAATMPLGGGILRGGTQVNLLNRRERDEELRRHRERSGLYVCYYPGCDYVIGRFCCVCLRPVCPNHSTRCKTCGCPVCEDHLVDGECTRCRPRPIATTRWGSVKEILGPIKIPALAIVTLLIFGRVMFYGEQLRSIHPSLPMVIITLYFGLQIPAAVFLAWRRKRKKPPDSSLKEGDPRGPA